MEVDQLREFKILLDENARLKKIIADQALSRQETQNSGKPSCSTRRLLLLSNKNSRSPRERRVKRFPYRDPLFATKKRPDKNVE